MDNIFPVTDLVSREEKEKLLKQKSKVIWIYGLSGAGKTTIARYVERKLYEKGFLTQILDGDNVRHGINNNLGFSIEDRHENIRRIAEVAKLFINSGIITICAFITPTEEARKIAEKIIGKEDFIEIFIDTPLEICEQRDVKGLYKKARQGLIKNFTGIDAPFERPESPDLKVQTSGRSIKETGDIVLSYVMNEIDAKSSKQKGPS